MGLPTDGFAIYDSIASSLGQSTWGPRLTAIKAGGFSVVINYGLLSGHITDITAYINYAAGLGLKVAVTLQDPRIWRDNTYSTNYPSLYADSGNASTGTAFMQYIVAQTKNLAGVWGWYIGDEPVATDHTTFATYAAAVKTADSTHPRLIIMGGYLNTTNSFGSATTAYYDSCDVGGDDYYPIRANLPGETSGVATEAAGIQAYCRAKGIQSAIALQAHSLVNYSVSGAAWPTETQMVQMRSDAINNMTPRLVIFYSYFDAISGAAPALQWTLLTHAAQGRSGYALFPPAVRRGSATPNTGYSTGVLARNPVAYYALSEASGLVAQDRTANMADGAISPTGITYAQPGALTNDPDTSLLFTGASSGVTLTTSSNGGGWTTATVEVWMKPTSFAYANGFGNVFSSGLSANKTGMILYLTSARQLTWGVGNGSAFTQIVYTAMPNVVGVWYHVVGVYDGSNVLLYINGVFYGSTPATGTISSSGAASAIGKAQASNSSYFVGNIEKVAVYHAALTGAQVLADYQTGITPARSTSTLFPAAKRRGD